MKQDNQIPPTTEFDSRANGSLALAEVSVSLAALLPFPQAGRALPSDQVVDQAFADFRQRRADGQAVDPDVFCADHYPHIKSSLGKLLQANSLMTAAVSAAVQAGRDDPAKIRWPECGEVFRDFELKLELGQGGFARVYVAHAKKLGDRPVVVKVSEKGNLEADVLGRILHPNVVFVYSSDTDPATGLTAVCMPYQGSATLHKVLDRVQSPGPPVAHAREILDIAQALPYPLHDDTPLATPDRIMRQGTYLDGIRWIGAKLADALAHLHSKGICHRDLKPSNVLLTPQGEPILLDFNLSADARNTINRLGGTLPYMPPEQLLATDENQTIKRDAMDARTDIYALGAILYQLVTGEHPFGPLSLNMNIRQLRAHLLEKQHLGPRQVRELNPQVDAALSALIQRCLACDPRDRPQTAVAVAQELRRQLSAPRRFQRWMGSNPAKSLCLALLLTALAVAALAAPVLRAPVAERQMASGIRAFQEGRFSETIHLCNDLLRADPENVTALLLRGKARVRMGDFNLAHDDFFQADRKSPDPRCKAVLGYCLNRMNQHKTATGAYEEALRLGLESAEVHNNLAYVYMRTNKMKEAKVHLDRALEINPKLQAAYHNRALWALNKARPKALQLGPQSKREDAYLTLLAGIEDVQKATQLGQSSIELQIDAAILGDMAARVEQGWIPFALSHLKEALRQGCDQQTFDNLPFTVISKDPSFPALRRGTAPATSVGHRLTRRLVEPNHDAGR